MRLSQRKSEGEVELVQYSLRNVCLFILFFSVTNGNFTFTVVYSPSVHTHTEVLWLP